MVEPSSSTEEPGGAADRSRASAQALAAVAQRRTALEGYALAITADHQLAEDAVQEVAALVAADPGRVPAGDARAAWLLGATRRKALELQRRARRGGTALSLDALEALEPAFAAAPVSAADELPERRRLALAHCVDGIPPGHRALLDARYGESLSADELAARVGRSVQGVYALLKRLRTALGRCVEARLAAERSSPNTTEGIPR